MIKVIQDNVRKEIVAIGCISVCNGNSEMIAYALGSCIALCLYEPIKHIGAMAHILLPSREYESENTKFADCALKKALEQMKLLGAQKHNIKAAIIGGAAMFPHGNCETLNIGKMNRESVIAELGKENIPISLDITGGKKSRTVSFCIPGYDFEHQIKVRYPSVKYTMQQNV